MLHTLEVSEKFYIRPFMCRLNISWKFKIVFYSTDVWLFSAVFSITFLRVSYLSRNGVIYFLHSLWCVFQKMKFLVIYWKIWFLLSVQINMIDNTFEIILSGKKLWQAIWSVQISVYTISKCWAFKTNVKLSIWFFWCFKRKIKQQLC